MGDGDARRMDTLTLATAKPASPVERSHSDLVDLLRVLVLVQGGLALLSTVEVLLWMLFSGGSAGPLGPTALITASLATATLAIAAGLRRRSRIARWGAFVIEAGIILVFLVDLGLALFMAHRALELVPILTRLVLPLAVIVLLRNRSVRADFASARAARAQEDQP
jgi:hypothetical protein